MTNSRIYFYNLFKKENSNSKVTKQGIKWPQGDADTWQDALNYARKQRKIRRVSRATKVPVFKVKKLKPSTIIRLSNKVKRKQPITFFKKREAKKALRVKTQKNFSSVLNKMRSNHRYINNSTKYTKVNLSKIFNDIKKEPHNNLVKTISKMRKKRISDINLETSEFKKNKRGVKTYAYSHGIYNKNAKIASGLADVDPDVYLKQHIEFLAELVGKEIGGVGKILVQFGCVYALRQKKDKSAGLDFKVKENNIVDLQKRYISSSSYDIVNPKDFIEEANVALTGRVQSNFIADSERMEGSGWKYEGIHTFQFSLYSSKFKSGSYIKIPKTVTQSKGVVNIKNKDDKCFLYSVVRGMQNEKKKNLERVDKKLKKDIKELYVENVSFPISSDMISSFEIDNNIAINIWKTDITNKNYIAGKNLIEITDKYRVSKLKKTKFKVNLLLIVDDEKSHYAWIKDINKLYANKSKNRKHVCIKCNANFTTESNLEKHIELCESEECKTEYTMPKKGTVMEFQNEKKKIRAPAVIYADLECFLNTYKLDDEEKYKLSEGKIKTEKVHEHTPSGYCFYVDQVKEYIPQEDCLQLYSKQEGDTKQDVCAKFVKKVMDVADKIKQGIELDITFTSEDSKLFNSATKCCVCDVPFKIKELKVRNHCPKTGKYKGAAHSKCNYKCTNSRDKISVFFHNAKGYDSHFILQSLSKVLEDEQISCIPENSEKFKQIEFGSVVIKDSFSFLSQSLNQLVRNNRVNNNYKNDFTHLYANLNKINTRNNDISKDDLMDLLTRKGCYPYEYMSDISKFSETKLPEHKSFYSNLNHDNVSEADYKFAQHMFETFKCKDMRDYHNLYLMSDVLLLADVFTNFRKMSMKYYELDPAHYLTLPQFGWDAMLLKTGTELELLTDMSMYEMYESGIRGGISYISHRHAKANHPGLKSYDDKKEKSYIGYFDANNLYGEAMSRPLPYGGFKWIPQVYIGFLGLTKTHINDFLMKTPAKGRGYTWEVDISYPKELHDAHSEYPLCPESMKIGKEHLSEYSTSLLGKFAKNHVSGNKLCTTLTDKKNYIIDHRNLQYYIKMGMRVTKIHRGLKYDEKAWMKPWIEFNTTKRSQSKNAFEKDLFKLLNNSCFGKSMMDVRKFRNFNLYTTFDKRCERKLDNFRTKNWNILIDSELLLVESYKSKTVLNKPIYAGFSILELSKLPMYNFHYGYIKPKYGDKAKLLFTDTDSLTYHIKTDDMYSDLNENKSKWFDFSDYNKDDPLYFTDNKKIPGFFSDECPDEYIDEFVGLRSKVYSFKMENKTSSDDKYKNTCKGIKKAVKNKFLKHNDYLNVLNNSTQHSLKAGQEIYSLRTFNQKMYTLKATKTALSAFDDKKYYVDNLNSLPYGHYKIKELESELKK